MTVASEMPALPAPVGDLRTRAKKIMLQPSRVGTPGLRGHSTRGPTNMPLDFSSRIDTDTLLQTLPDAPSPDVSDKYAFIDTKRVVQDMRDLGFEVAGFRRPKFRTKSGAFALHEVDFRRPQDLDREQGEAPRVLFMNTYDGSRRAQIVSGVIRFICSNGLIAGNIVDNQKFLHLGDYEEELLTQIKEAGEASAKIFDRIERFRSVRLSVKGYQEMAAKGHALRFGSEPEALSISPTTLLQPRRREDASRDLWTTWNVLQENLMRGGLPAKDANGVTRITRPVNQIQRSNDLNRALWDLAEEFAEAA